MIKGDMNKVVLFLTSGAFVYIFTVVAPFADSRILRKAYAPSGLIFNLLTISQGGALCY